MLPKVLPGVLCLSIYKALKQRKESLESKESILSFSVVTATLTRSFWWEDTGEMKWSLPVALLMPSRADSAKDLEFPLPQLLGADRPDFSQWPLFK